MGSSSIEDVPQKKKIMYHPARSRHWWLTEPIVPPLPGVGTLLLRTDPQLILANINATAISLSRTIFFWEEQRSILRNVKHLKLYRVLKAFKPLLGCLIFVGKK